MLLQRGVARARVVGWATGSILWLALRIGWALFQQIGLRLRLLLCFLPLKQLLIHFLDAQVLELCVSHAVGRQIVALLHEHAIHHNIGGHVPQPAIAPAPAGHVPHALGRLWHREMRRRVYYARLVPVRISRGRRVRALAFIADPDHAQYCRELDFTSRAQLVAQGVGERGRCTDYIRHTLEHMYALGVTDPHLARVLETAEAMRARADSSRAR